MTTEPDAEREAPRSPRAPSHNAWLAMSAAERAAVVEALPAYTTDAEQGRGEVTQRLRGG